MRLIYPLQALNLFHPLIRIEANPVDGCYHVEDLRKTGILHQKPVENSTLCLLGLVAPLELDQIAACMIRHRASIANDSQH